MEPNGLGGSMFPSISTGLLGVDTPLQQQQQQQNLQNQQNPHTLHHPQMVYASHHDTDTHTQPQQSMKHGYPYSSAKAHNNNNNKPQSSNLSDDDEAGFAADDSSGDPKRKASPWHRMKWTDAMVRLLIMAVYYIGDEAGSEGGADPAGKKKTTGLLQKKGKWKSVSRAMMEKGFYVSPQQCEDKFNDLNKRYKRVNDILGKGTACRVVENQSLLDTMDLSPKMKEEVRKLLNSKHLFFREMCAYHNSCGHGTTGGGAHSVQHSAEVGAEPSQSQQSQQQQQQPQQHTQQRCFHSSVNGVGGMLKEDDDEDEDDDSEDYSDEEEEESLEGGSRGQVEDDENDVRSTRKRPRSKGGFCVSSSSTQVMQQLNGEVNGVLQDGGRSPWEKKQWMKKRVIQLEEQQISYQEEAFQLEKQRLKWARFSSKKEREMEREKLENERRRLENERMVLILRQKELELMGIQHKQQQLQQHQHSST